MDKAILFMFVGIGIFVLGFWSGFFIGLTENNYPDEYYNENYYFGISRGMEYCSWIFDTMHVENMTININESAIMEYTMKYKEKI